MTTLRDVLQYVAYGAELDICELDGVFIEHIFEEDQIINRGVIECAYPGLLDRELCGGIHAEGQRENKLFIPLIK